MSGFLGSLLALPLVTVATVAVGLGSRFAARLRTKWLPRIAGLVFASFAVAAGWTIVLG